MATLIRPLDLSDRPLVTDYLRQYPPEISEMTFTNLYVWRKSRPMWIAEMDGTIVFLIEFHANNRRIKAVFGPPIGKLPPLSVARMLGEEVEGFIRVTEEVANILKDGGFRVTLDRANADYVYRVADLAGLEGRRFHKKRNLIAQCLREYTCQYEPVIPQLIPECIEMQERWCKARHCDLDPSLCNEYSTICEVFSHYCFFNLIGGAIRVDGIIQAYAIGETLRPGTAVCHFEKAMPGIQGLSQLINQWFAKYSVSEFTFVNREQDLDIPGLRQAKASYYPHHMVNKYNAFLKSKDSEMLHHLEAHECSYHTLRTDEGN